MVEDGKISSEDASDLIEAFEEADASEQVEAGVGATQGGSTANGSGPTTSTGTAGKDPFSAFFETVEKFGRETARSVDWQEISKQVRQSAHQGFEALKVGLDQVGKGRGFVWMGPTETREITLPLSVPEGKTLRIENPAGDIRIAGGSEKGEVVARAQFRGLTPEDSRRSADEYTLLVEESDGTVLVRQPDIPNVTVDLVISLPGSTAVEVRSSSGDISVIDTRSSCRINARSSDIRLRNLDGVVEVNTMSGEITVEDVNSTQVTLENKSGDLKLRRITGNLYARTTSGDVELLHCDGKSMSVETVSGGVDAKFKVAVSGSVNIRTVSGDCAVWLPDGSDCRVALSTLRGKVDSEIALTDEAKAEQRVTGRLGAGSGTLDISAVSGDVELRQTKAEVTE